MKFGERTLATAGSDDFTDDDFFPDLGNLFLNDMGDNLNANGAAPVAPYVFLSFLFEIMVEFMIYFVIIRIKSRSNLLIYSTVATSPTATLVSWMA